MKITEATVAAAVMEHLVEDGWECWPEVVLPEGRADIVAVRPFPFMAHRRSVHIVETKTSWSLTLLEQAVSRKQYAHYVSIAAPTNPNNYFVKLCRREGIGLIRLRPHGAECSVDSYTDYNYSRAALQRHKRGDRYFGPDRTLAALHEDQKRFAPGTTAAAGYSTAWARTMGRAVEYVGKNPGVTAKQLASAVEHHYSNNAGARQGFLLWLSKRPEISARKEGGAMRFYLHGAASVAPGLPLENK